MRLIQISIYDSKGIMAGNQTNSLILLVLLWIMFPQLKWTKVLWKL